MRKLFRVFVVVAMASVVVGLGAWSGCTGLQSSGSNRVRPEVMPAELEPVIADEAAFATDSGSPLASVEAGTVVDSLDELGGCWAVYYQYTIEADGDSMAADTSVNAYEVYRFDADTGDVEYQLYQEAVSGAVGVLLVYEGQFTVLDESRVQTTWEKVTVSDPNTGQLQTQAITEDATTVMIIARSGDELRIWPESGDADNNEPLRIYNRFDCP